MSFILALTVVLIYPMRSVVLTMVMFIGLFVLALVASLISFAHTLIAKKKEN